MKINYKKKIIQILIETLRLDCLKYFYIFSGSRTAHFTRARLPDSPKTGDAMLNHSLFCWKIFCSLSQLFWILSYLNRIICWWIFVNILRCPSENSQRRLTAGMHWKLHGSQTLLSEMPGTLTSWQIHGRGHGYRRVWYSSVFRAQCLRIGATSYWQTNFRIYWAHMQPHHNVL